MFFINKFMADAKAKMEPDAQIKVTELTKQGAKVWNEMSDADKTEFVKIAEEDKARFDKEMDEFQKTGYFTNKDGVNSKDLTPKIKKIKKSSETDDTEQTKQSGGVNKPKKACVAFMFFVKEKSANLMKER